MKSHVKEAQARQAIANCMRKVPQSDGTTLLEFSGVVQEIIDDRAKSLGVKLRRWRMNESNKFYVTWIKNDVSNNTCGDSINDVLDNVQRELEQNNG